MKNLKKIAIAALAFTGMTFAQETKKQDNPFSAKWKSGLRIENADKSIKLKLGGRIMYDTGYFWMNSEGTDNGYTLKTSSGDEFRRARFFTSGTLYNNIDFKLQLDFGGNKAVLKDAHITLTKIPVIGNFRVGHFLQPFSLEAISSSKYMTFTERSLHNSFMDERNSGFTIFNQVLDKKLSWQLALMRESGKTSDNKEANGRYSLGARVAGNPIKNDNMLVHLGVAHKFIKPQDDHKFGFKVRPEIHTAEKYLKVGLADVTDVNMTNFEAALISGAFSLQGEFVTISTKTLTTTENFTTFYAQASYFLTGEKRGYKNSLVGFSRVKPKKNFGQDGGFGALQIAARYSQIEGLNNDNMSNITAGLNWHLNPATRVMLNYVISDIENKTDYANNGKGQFTGLQMRFQIDF